MTPHSSRRQALRSLAAPLLLYGGVALWVFAWARPQLHALTEGVLVTIGLFALWRYGWQLLNYLRAWFYATYHYPRLRRHADRVAAGAALPQRIFVVVASYLEDAWVSVETFQSLMSNLAELPGQATVVVAVGSDEDEAVITSVYRAHPAFRKVELVFQRQSKGKRIAMGHALRAVARRYRDEPHSVTVFMDGDSWLEPGALRRCLPFFMAFGDLGAVTTNEVGFIPGRSPWYRDWFGLKFGQRHVLFQSHSLSNKVLTLTGRFSLLRTAIVVREDFIASIENDSVTHWMHGRFRFLMGDDKSSWFYLLRNGWNMLYLPDVTCCSLESRDVGFLKASVSLPYRWFGNTLRNNPRALALGPGHTGWFIWMAILDQRLSMWTSLVGLSGALVLSATKSLLYLPLYLAWAVLVRLTQLAMIVLHGHAVTWRSIPLMLYMQWVGAFVKISAWFHLSDQNWSKGKARQIGGVEAVRHPLQRVLPTGAMLLSYLVFGFAVLLAHSALRLPDLHLFAAEASSLGVQARSHGVTPDDGRDDAAALQALIDRVGGKGAVHVQLPPGQLDFHKPLVIRHSGVTLAGAGQEKTRIVSHLRSPAAAVISAEGALGKELGTLAQGLAVDATSLRLNRAAELAAGDAIWLKQPNDEALFSQLGSQKWRRTYPYLRQAMLQVASASGAQLQVQAPAGVAFDAGLAKVYRVNPVRGVKLSDFTLEQRAGDRPIAQVRHRYENLEPEVAVDGIVLDWTLDAVVERVSVLAAGRHPVSIEHSYGFTLRDCLLQGAWNKGEGGNGYLRIARSFRGSVQGCQVKDIRHIALQWSSAFNRLSDLYTEVDINFHGGLSHHNVAENIASSVPPEHPWKAVFITPPDALWAPPDGPGNQVIAGTANTAPRAAAALPAR